MKKESVKNEDCVKHGCTGCQQPMPDFFEVSIRFLLIDDKDRSNH